MDHRLWKPRFLLLNALLFSISLQAIAAPALPLKTLVVCDDVADPATLDPHKQFSEKNHTLLQQIYEGLVRFTPDGKIEPALAVSWERVDPLRVRFKLREGVTFHNGEPFNGEAVRFSIERYLNPQTGFPAFGFISSLERVEVVDDHTVDIVTKFPDGLLLNRLAGFILIVPPRYIQDEGEEALAVHPMGTGAFQYDRWEKGKRIVLKASERYWLKGYPKIDMLVFRFVPSDKQVDTFLAGGVDLLTELPGTRTFDVANSKRGKVVKQEALFTIVGALNFSEGPLKDKRVRQALNYAINREEVIRYDVLGNGKAIATITMSGEEGHNSDLKPYPYDPQKARALLSEAGYKEGLKLKVLVKEQSARTAGIIRKQLEAVGVLFSIKMTTDSEILKDTQSQPWDIFFAPCPDPMGHDFFIQSIFYHSKSPYSLGKNEKYDTLLEEMAGTLDSQARAQQGRRIDAMIHDEAFSLFTYQQIRTYAVKKNVMFFPFVTGMPYYYLTQFNANE
jgi:peptide/nickel transport system substrate-binding protein